MIKRGVYLSGVIDSKFNCNFYSAALVYGDFCVNSNRVKLALLSKRPLFIATAQAMTSATATAFLFTRNNHPRAHSTHSFWLCKEPSAAYSHPTISKHTLANAGISRPTGKCSSVGLGGCYLNKCLLNLGHYVSASAT